MRSLSVLLWLAVLLTVLACGVEGSGSTGQRQLQGMDFDDEQRAETVQEWLHDLPRYTFTFEEVSNEWEPTSWDYYQVRSAPCRRSRNADGCCSRSS